MALSVDSPEQSNAMIREMALPFELLCDENKEVVNLYGLLNPLEHDGIAYPAIFIIKKNSIIGFRSLDRTAKRVQLDDILNYLKILVKNPEYLMQSELKRHNIIPSPSELIQIGKNMILRGNKKDWVHYIFFPFKIIKSSVKKTSRK